MVLSTSELYARHLAVRKPVRLVVDIVNYPTPTIWAKKQSRTKTARSAVSVDTETSRILCFDQPLVDNPSRTP